MLKQIPPRALFVLTLVSVATVLTACGSITSSSTVLKDRTKYLQENFSATVLFPPVRAEVDKGPAFTPKFKSLVLDAETQQEGEDKKHTREVKMTYTSIGKGLVQEQWEFSNNGVPYRLNTGLTYAGVFALRVQTLFLNQSTTQQAWDRRTLTKFGRGITHPVKGQTYQFEGEWAMGGAMGGVSRRKDCTAGETRPASTVHAALQGDLVELICESKNENGVVSFRERRAWLADYGAAILIESKSSSEVSTVRYLKVSME